MNLESVRKEIIDHHKEREKKKKEKEETITFIERVMLDLFKSSGKAVIQQAIDELILDFNKGL